MRLKSWFVFLILCAFVGMFVLGAAYAKGSKRIVLYYYGGAPEVPGGRALVILNPFRDHVSEETAGRLINELRTAKCAEGLQGFHSDPGRICPVMSANRHARLIWRADGESSRVLVYDLPESKSGLWITFAIDESGWEVRAVSLIR
jgi:hypothetical protein